MLALTGATGIASHTEAAQVGEDRGRKWISTAELLPSLTEGEGAPAYKLASPDSTILKKGRDQLGSPLSLVPGMMESHTPL